MATLYISEYRDMPVSSGKFIPVAQEPALAVQTVAIGGSSAASSAFTANTRFVRLHTDAICSVSFGTAPVATAVLARMAAGATEFFGVIGGSKVAVITNS